MNRIEGRKTMGGPGATGGTDRRGPKSPRGDGVGSFGRRVGLLLLVSLLLPVPSMATAPRISDPDLFEKSLRAARSAVEQYGPWENTEEMERLVEIGYRIVDASGFTEFPISFHLIDMAVPNAFALPGGQIFVTRGMLALDLDDDMLAALLGHEIAHVVRRHGVRMSRRATLLNAVSQAILVGVIVGASGGGNSPPPVYDPYGRGGSNKGDLVQGTAAAGLVVSELLLRSYSREFEDEADEEGQRWAATAGYSPSGTQKLMTQMSNRLPESREYGYWRTHPFLEDRAQAASARGEYLQPQEAQAEERVSDLRRSTQGTLLSFLEGREVEEPDQRLIKEEALAAWPSGREAEAIRLERLQRMRDEELENRPLYRDYGELVEAYRQQAGIVARLDPESPLLATLTEEEEELEASRLALLADAEKVLEDGVYETEFLETFVSNFPDVPATPRVTLALGEAYSRLGRQTEAVDAFLRVWEGAPESEEAEKARRGLQNLAPVLRSLGALEELATRSGDPALADLAAHRLDEIVGSFEELSNGAEYLSRFPEGEHSEPVRSRVHQLADGLYGEVVLYQAVGDHLKALERIQKILEYAPLSPAAEKLREGAVLGS